MSRWEHIVWDWNGTLLADTHVCVEVLNELLAERGLEPMTPERYRETFDFPVIEFYRSLGFPADRPTFEATSHEFISRYARRSADCPLHDGAAELLHGLASDAFGQTVLSAAKQDALEQAIHAHGLARCFRHLVGAIDIYAHGKEEHGVTWLRETRLDPDGVVLVGDTLHDHKVAEAMGVRCVLVAHGHHSRERLETTGRPVVEGFAELGEWLGR